MNLNNYLGKIEKDDFFVDRETRHLIEEILQKVSLNRPFLYYAKNPFISRCFHLFLRTTIISDRSEGKHKLSHKLADYTATIYCSTSESNQNFKRITNKGYKSCFIKGK